jgi:hypothetical protein
MAPEFGKPIHQLPLVPANVLKKHRVHEPLDPRFRSAARLLQALWRKDRGFFPPRLRFDPIDYFLDKAF